MKITRRMAACAASLSVPFSISMPMVAAVGVAGAGFIATPAQAARCTDTGGGAYSCTLTVVRQSFNSNIAGSCSGPVMQQSVSYQVPEETPPAGGWPVAIFFSGTGLGDADWPAGTMVLGPYVPLSTYYGSGYLMATMHELLDEPGSTGRKYAVIYPQVTPQLGGTVRLWDTNFTKPYEWGSDTCFLPALLAALKSGAYGPPGQFNTSQRYAWGMSSGGYNTSRMAVSWNSDGGWKALAINSASYATCLGLLCAVPLTLPANHPPTKFYHGTNDTSVPVSTMYPYYQVLLAQGVPTEAVVDSSGHEVTANAIGPGGVKAWFDRF